MTATKKGRAAVKPVKKRAAGKKPARRRRPGVVKIEAFSWDGELLGQECQVVWVKGRSPMHSMGCHDGSGLDTLLETLKDEYEEQDGFGGSLDDYEDMDDDEKEAIGHDDLVGAHEVVIRFRRLKKEPPGYAAVMKKIRDKAERQRREDERKGAPAP